MRSVELMRRMDIASYLQQQKDNVGKESRHVKDFSVFDFNYIPAKPLMRDECKELIDEMLQFEVSGIANHLAIIGSRGSGKTLLVKYLQRVIHAETSLAVLYANCRHHNTSFKILAHLLEVQARGTSLSELYDRFCVRYPGKTVVVLDEVDLMSSKDRRRDILYFLSRSESPFMVIMLSNNPRVMKELDAATKSSLQPIPLHFRNYNAEQLQRILSDRAKRGLHKWDEGHLSEIAALTTRLGNSDARVGIKALQYSVMRPQKTLRDNFERARRDVVVDMINDLSDANLMIVQAVVKSGADFAKDIYQQYCKIAGSQRENPFSYVYFYSNLSYLQSLGLVALVSTKRGRIYANRVLLTFEQEILEQIFQLRFEK